MQTMHPSPMRAFEYIWNHLIVLLVLAGAVTAPFADSEYGTCPIANVRKTVLQTTHSSDATPGLDQGVAYDLPAEAVLFAGSAFLLVGIAMLLFPWPFRRAVSCVVFVTVLALLAEEGSSRLLLDNSASPLDLTFTLTRGPDELSSLRVDLPCTGSAFAVFAAIWAGLHLMALQTVKRASLFFEGAVCAVLLVRMLADFLPVLLEPQPLSGAAQFFLGYPVVPFWAVSIPLALLIGAIPQGGFRVVITSFLGAFAATKGLRTILGFLDGQTSLELSGGADVHADPVQGAIQSGLFLVALVMHQRIWLQGEEPGNEIGCCGNCCACCPCANDEPPSSEGDYSPVTASVPRQTPKRPSLPPPRRSTGYEVLP